MAKTEPRGRIAQLYREMKIGEWVIVNIERQRAFHLLRSTWKRHHRREHIADGYPVPWLYLEPRGTNRTLIVRMNSDAEVKAARAAYLQYGPARIDNGTGWRQQWRRGGANDSACGGANAAEAGG